VEKVTFKVGSRLVEYIETPQETDVVPYVIAGIACLACIGTLFWKKGSSSPAVTENDHSVAYDHQDFVGYHGSKFELRIPILDTEYWETSPIALHMKA